MELGKAVYLAMIVVAALSIGTLFWRSADLADQGKQAHQAVCALRHDLELRVNSSVDFLRSHPAGIPGIPPSIIRNGVANQRQTIDALSDLDC